MRLDNEEFEVKANLGLIVRGSIKELDQLLTLIKDAVGESDSQIVFKEVSADRLWISRETQNEKNEKYE